MSGVGIPAGATGFADAVSAQAALVAVQRATIVAERAGMLTLARRHADQVETLIKLGRIDREAGNRLKDSIRAFVDQAAQGLHRDEADPDGVREAMASRSPTR